MTQQVSDYVRQNALNLLRHDVAMARALVTSALKEGDLREDERVTQIFPNFIIRIVPQKTGGPYITLAGPLVDVAFGRRNVADEFLIEASGWEQVERRIATGDPKTV
jgi:hypothetical protein